MTRNHLKANIEAIQAQRENDTVTTYCAHCPWTYHGTFAEGKRQHKAHRAIHPQTKPSRKRTGNQQMLAKHTLDHNIANARQQGAHRWDTNA